MIKVRKQSEMEVEFNNLKSQSQNMVSLAVCSVCSSQLQYLITGIFKLKLFALFYRRLSSFKIYKTNY